MALQPVRPEFHPLNKWSFMCKRGLGVEVAQNTCSFEINMLGFGVTRL